MVKDIWSSRLAIDGADRNTWMRARDRGLEAGNC